MLNYKFCRSCLTIQNYANELTKILHRILDLASDKINLQQVPNWSRGSVPKTPIVQKLGLIVIPILYPWWSEHLEINYEQFGPMSPCLSESFYELLEDERCQITDEQLIIQPPSFDEIVTFPEITELLLSELIHSSSNPILEQFENLEIFSIISVEQASYFREQGIRRQMFTITDEDELELVKRVFSKMMEIPHLNDFIHKRKIPYVKNYILERIQIFYHAVSLSVSSQKHQPSFS